MGRFGPKVGASCTFPLLVWQEVAGWGLHDSARSYLKADRAPIFLYSVHSRTYLVDITPWRQGRGHVIDDGAPLPSSKSSAVDSPDANGQPQAQMSAHPTS